MLLLVYILNGKADNKYYLDTMGGMSENSFLSNINIKPLSLTSIYANIQ